ncbi:hypothetical protein [Sphingomonas sp.]|uniref:hypothetical protein n=1 Tax=Sphingomonas sp. TaxID=28214 RepID=UPI00286DE749|nr:hypothetical protein [Sphingomonas sp.]
MLRLCLTAVLIGAAAASAASAQIVPANAPANPRAAELFTRDGILLAWALGQFDADRDGTISIAEAQPAARQFKIIADGDRDGRVTPYEYDRAREFIAARF